MPVFGCTDPPPEVWAMLERIEAGEGKAEDVLGVRGYVACHGDERFEFLVED